LSIDTPLDYANALFCLSNKKSLYFMMLGRFLSQTLAQEITKIKDAMDTLNWTQVKEVAHSLKSSSGYVGASRIHYDCYFMQEAYNIKELPKVG
jgi:HPt (histidine-containing phosphotransfer) domain-containing protein